MAQSVLDLSFFEIIQLMTIQDFRVTECWVYETSIMPLSGEKS